MVNGNNANPEVDFVFKDWLNLLQKFYNDIEQTLDTVRQDKREIQEIKDEIYNRINKGYYMYDDNRIIISAPEIIIGNVDKSGQLRTGASKVIIRSNDISLEGVGNTGKVQTKATTIQQLAVDPGDDGLEEVVHDNACIASQARSIVLDSNNAKQTYTRDVGAKYDVGIKIHSDQNLVIDSSVSKKELTDDLDAKISVLDGEIGRLRINASSSLTSLNDQIREMEETLRLDQKLCQSEDLSKVNVSALDSLHLLLTSRSITFFNTINEFLTYTSEVAEKIRQKNSLKAAKLEVSDDAFNEQAIGANLILNAESITLNNLDGDFNQRTNPEAKITLKSQNIDIQSTDMQSKNLKDGHITMWGENVDIYTNDVKPGENKDELEMPISGNFTVNSKYIRLLSNDLKGKQGESMEIKDLAVDSLVQISSQNIDINNVDQKGACIGTTSIRGKDINISSVNLKEDSLEEDKVTSGGHVVLEGEKIKVGERSQGTKMVGLFADKLYSMGTNGIYAMLDDKKKYFKLLKNCVKFNAPNVDVFGDKFNVNADAEFSKKLETLDALTAKTAKIKESFEAPNTKAASPVLTPPSSVAKVAISKEEQESRQDENDVNDEEKQENNESKKKFNDVIKASREKKLLKKTV